MHELALFAGAGGGILGSRLLGWRTVCGVEINPYCREVLLRRQEEGHLEPFPIWDDARTFDGRPWRGAVDVVTAGFPCQPWSVMGKSESKDDTRNLWPDTIRIIREVQPAVCLLENVPGLKSKRHGYFGQVLGDLAESRYDCRWDCIPASALGAPHQRDRLWIVAYPTEANWWWEARPDDARRRLEEARRSMRGSWPPGLRKVSDIPRMADGVAYRVDRADAVGEGQVPTVVTVAWRLLSSL